MKRSILMSSKTKSFIYKNNLDINDLNKSYEESEKVINTTFELDGNPVWMQRSDKLRKIVNNLSNVAHSYSEQFKESLNSYAHLNVQSTLNIEGVNSSIKSITDTMNKKKSTDISTLINNQINAYNYLDTSSLTPLNISIAHKILTTDVDMGENETDGLLFRENDVYITNGVMGSKISKGSSSNHILDNLESICSIPANMKYNDAFINLFVTHYIFEATHPFYDYNGRLGRILIETMSHKYGLNNHMAMYTIGARLLKNDHYYESFDKTFFQKRFRNDATYFVAKQTVMMLTTGVGLYTIANIKNALEFSTNSLHDEILLNLLFKPEGWYEVKDLIINKEDYNPTSISRVFRSLVAAGILMEKNSKPKQYSLNWHNGIYKIIDRMVGNIKV